MKPVQIQFTVTLDEEAGSKITEWLSAALRQVGNQWSQYVDDAAERRRKASLHANLAGETPPDDFALLLDSKEAAKLLRISTRTLDTLRSQNRIPPPIRIGSLVRWSRESLE